MMPAPADQASPAPPQRRTYVLVLALLTAFTAAALLTATSSYLFQAPSPQPSPWTAFLTGHAVHWHLWAALSPLLFWLAGRLSLERRHAWVWALAFVLLCGPFAVLHAALEYGLFELAPRLRGAYPEMPLAFSIGRHLGSGVLSFWALASSALGLRYFRRFQEQAAHVEALEQAAAEPAAESAPAEPPPRPLPAPLHPAFLHETLHAVATLMYRDAEAADRVLFHLDSLLRRAHERSDRPTVTLREELEWVYHYLRIEEVASEHRLSVAFDVPEDLLELEVPTMILHPLVENALQHGLPPARTPGTLRIRGRLLHGRIARGGLQSGCIAFEVIDNGIGPHTNSREGVGLASTRARLQEHYGDGSTLTLSTAEPAGCCARIAFRVNGLPFGSLAN